MKRLLPVFLCAAMLLTACGEPTGDSESSVETIADAVTNPAETTAAPEQSNDSAADSKAENDTADKQTATTAAVAATEKKADAPVPSPSGEELPIIGGDNSTAEKPDSAAQSEPAFPDDFEDDGVIELPVIPLR